MATAARVLANRDNAQLSTGSRTGEGRAKSSLNNLEFSKGHVVCNI